MLTREQLLSPVDDATWRRLDAYLRGQPTLANVKHQLPSLIAAVLDDEIRLGDDGWIIPRQTKSGWAAVIQTGYKYALRRMYEAGAQSVEAAIVYEGEIVRFNGSRCIEHRAEPFGDPSRKIVGAWARITSSTGIEYDGAVARAELDRLATGARPGEPWAAHFEPMAKKTAILRAAKFSPYRYVDPDDAREIGETADVPAATTPAHEFAPITAEEDF